MYYHLLFQPSICDARAELSPKRAPATQEKPVQHVSAFNLKPGQTQTLSSASTAPDAAGHFTYHPNTPLLHRQ